MVGDGGEARGRKFAMKRSKEIHWERRGELNLLMLRQSYLAR